MKGRIMKKGILIMMGAAVAIMATGCSTTPVAFAPIGPNPAAIQTTAANGQLAVFSALSGRAEGDNPIWYQHSDYYICDSHGRRLEHVENSTGHYAQSPRVISLPPGKYIVVARAKDVLKAKVPVVIKPGEITFGWQLEALGRTADRRGRSARWLPCGLARGLSPFW
jgi:hypothetical protein